MPRKKRYITLECPLIVEMHDFIIFVGHSLLPAYFKNAPSAASFKTSESPLNIIVGSPCLRSIQ